MARLMDEQRTLSASQDLSLSDEDPPAKNTKLLVVKAREQHQLFIEMLSGLTNMNVNSLKCMLCQDHIDDELEREKDAIVYVSFSGKEIPVSRQSLEKLTQNFSKVIALLKEWETNTTSSTSNVKNTLKYSMRDLDESTLHDSENITIVKRARAVVTDDDETTRFHDSISKSLNGGIQDDSDYEEPVDRPSGTSKNEFAASFKELDEFPESKENSVSSQSEPFQNEHENKLNSSNSATFPREEDEMIVSSTDSSENETEKNVGDCDESSEDEQSDSFRNESKSNLRFPASPTFSSDDECSSSDESVTFSYSFDEIKDGVVSRWKKLKEHYKEELSISRRKFDVAYINSNGDFKILGNNSVGEAKLRAFNLKDITRVPFPVVLIVLDDESSACTTARKKSKASLSEVGRKDWPTVHGSLHCTLEDDHCEFPMRLNLDTGADSGSVGYKYDIVKNFILTVDNINGRYEPAVLCKVSVHSIMSEEVQVFDIDEDSKWNAIGLATLKKI